MKYKLDPINGLAIPKGKIVDTFTSFLKAFAASNKLNAIAAERNSKFVYYVKGDINPIDQIYP